MIKQLTKKEFFKKMASEGWGLTFGDMLLRPRRSGVKPVNTNVSTMFSRRVPLKIPIVSAAMDTVTEATMAIELAMLGGLGVIHRALSPKDQAKQVAHVKLRMNNGFINCPITINPKTSVNNVLKMKTEKDYLFDTFPVVEHDGKLVGLLNKKRFDMCIDKTVRVADIMLKSEELITVKKKISLEAAYQIMLEKNEKVLLLIDDNGLLAGIYTFSDIKRDKSKESVTYNIDKNGQLYVGAAIGVGEEALERAALLVKNGVDVLVIDTAHGDSAEVYSTLKTLRGLSQYDGVDIVAGNIAEGDAARALAEAGADGIKIGVGPGSICTTRIITGVGVPQITAIYECWEAIRSYNIPVCADGGIREPGDISKAIAAGASSVMLGSILAGTDPTPGDVIEKDGKQFKRYRGMGSSSAMKESAAARERYRQGSIEVNKVVPEGVDVEIPYKRSLSDVVYRYVGGLRASMGYLGATTIAELQEKACFIRQTPVGLAEAYPHILTLGETSSHRKEV